MLPEKNLGSEARREAALPQISCRSFGAASLFNPVSITITAATMFRKNIGAIALAAPQYNTAPYGC
jgi:hypothetical protein